FAAIHGVSPLEPVALAKVLQPTLAAQRAAESVANKVNQARVDLEQDREHLKDKEISQRNLDIKSMEEEYAFALKNVTSQIRRELAGEVKAWDKLQVDMREREQTEAARKLEEERIRKDKQMEREALLSSSLLASLCSLLAAIIGAVVGAVGGFIISVLVFMVV